MSALDNVLVGMHARLKSNAARRGAAHAALPSRGGRGARARRWSCCASSGCRASTRSGRATWPYGDQRRLEVARALATEPRLLLLDEPTAGMNAQETAALTRLIGRLRDRARADHPADRARHEGGHGHLGPRDRAGLRAEDRRGHAARGAAQPARDRGVSRARPRPEAGARRPHGGVGTA